MQAENERKNLREANGLPQGDHIPLRNVASSRRWGEMEGLGSIVDAGDGRLHRSIRKPLAGTYLVVRFSFRRADLPLRSRKK